MFLQTNIMNAKYVCIADVYKISDANLSPFTDSAIDVIVTHRAGQFCNSRNWGHGSLKIGCLVIWQTSRDLFLAVSLKGLWVALMTSHKATVCDWSVSRSHCYACVTAACYQKRDFRLLV